jgi:alkanesulfonate monooxygenase SsuD/methylene tetrahydromethanopterin reductase-like flavin-dependent oxidoreductase (luciferase family)
MDESRERFKESLDIVRDAFTKEWISHEGGFYNVPRTSVRPMPRPGNKLIENMYIAWGSPQSMPVAAHENIKPLFIPQRGWDELRQEIAEYNRIRVRSTAGGRTADSGVLGYCAETDAQAEEGARRYMAEYADSAFRHYQFMGEHLQNLKGYEYYAQMARCARPCRRTCGRGPVPHEPGVGQPEDVHRELENINNTMGADDFVAVFSYGSMPVEKAETSMRLFAEKVLPVTQAMAPAEIPLGVGALA